MIVVARGIICFNGHNVGGLLSALAEPVTELADLQHGAEGLANT